MDVFLLCLYAYIGYVLLSCVGRGLCDELLPRSKEFYHVCNKDSEIQMSSGNVDVKFQHRKEINLLVNPKILWFSSAKILYELAANSASNSEGSGCEYRLSD
jgi:hypothetical protein